MLKRWFSVLLSLATCLGTVAAEPPAHKKVPIIGLDGCRPDALQQAPAPHLHALIRDGAFSDQAQTGDITISGPGWASLLTGVWRDKHGIRDNKFEGANLRQFPHFFRRLKEARPDAYTASIVHWEPIATHLVTAANLSGKYLRDARVAEEACKVLSEQAADAIFVHFDDVDGAGHKYGFHPTVKAYLQAIRQTDVYVGQLLKAVRERKTYSQEDWLVLVSTDHGGSGTEHGKDIPEHRTIFLIVSGPSVARGRIEPPPAIVDVAATALTHLGVPIQAPWQLDGKPVGLKQAKESK
jgi:predicted AlkP superfamily pyrophosphatase or phosphodiesterase